jgi:short subunit dehydrogenase-like uncharacterized protein
LIYGATGHTGRLIAEKARALNGDVLLAGRNPARTKALAQSLGLPWRQASLEDAASVDDMLAGVDVVLHAAGPFTVTARTMVEACLRTRTHYLDIAGELPVFQAVAGYDHAAREAGVMVMPGGGFAIVATDCLAAHAASLAPAAKYLRLALSMPKSLSRGSIRTILGLVRGSVSIGRNGKLTTVPIGRMERSFDYGEGDRWSTCVNWPDAYTAMATTGIPNAEVYIEADIYARSLYHVGGLLAAPLQLKPIQAAMSSWAGLWPDAPAANESSPSQCVVAEVEDEWRQCTRVRLRTIDGYSFTALSTFHLLQRILAGDVRSGFQTPARVYGPDLVLHVPGTVRETVTHYQRAKPEPSHSRRQSHGTVH